MRTMSQSIFELYRAGVITGEEAYHAAPDPADFSRLMQRSTSSSLADR